MQGKGSGTMTHSRSMRLVTLAALVPLAAACGTLVPAEGPSKYAQRPKIDSGPSSQRLGPDGYPLLGAYPKAATVQLTEPVVVAERNTLKATAGVQNTGVSSAAEYRRSLAEAAAVRAQTRRQVDAAVSGSGGAGAGADASGEDVLRQIEGR